MSRAPTAYLFGATGVHSGECHELVADRTVLGRGDDATIRLVDVLASRNHCEIVRDAAGFRLRDLTSKNGTALNGLPVEEKVLEQGDEIRIGETVFYFTHTSDSNPADLLSTRHREVLHGLGGLATLSRGPIGGGRLVGTHPKMKALYRQIEKVAPLDLAVLVRGESGTGKDLVASTLHENSPRRTHPFVAVNCAALATELLESELFGHEKGAFSGAHARRRGLFEQAAGGTIFLDEIAEMDPGCQVALLRVIQEKRIRRVGGTEEIPVDVRVVAATHRDLEGMIEEGRFRQDLYFRLSGVELRLPSLRERPEDVPALAEHFVRQYAATARRRIQGITKEALERLSLHPWPGNVRELRNAIERAVVMGSSQRIGVDDILLPDVVPDPDAEPPSLAEVEAAHIARVLDFAGGQIARAARILGIQRSTLYRKIKEYGLSAGPEEGAAEGAGPSRD